MTNDEYLMFKLLSAKLDYIIGRMSLMDKDDEVRVNAMKTMDQATKTMEAVADEMRKGMKK